MPVHEIAMHPMPLADLGLDRARATMNATVHCKP
jgi:hypothetical protein